MGMGTACHSPLGFLKCEVEEEVVVRVSSQAIYTPRSPCDKLDIMMYELFCIQDLKSDGFLEEAELMELNEGIAVLHHGRDVDRSLVRKKYKDLFREKLHPAGEPVKFSVFRGYMREVLDSIDRDMNAQEMILDQFIAEAAVARELLFSEADVFSFSPCSAASDHMDDVAEITEGPRPLVQPTTPPSSRALARPPDDHSRL